MRCRNTHFFLTAVLLLNLLWMQTSADTGGGQPPEFRLPLVSGQVHCDAVLDEDIWKKALLLTLDYEVRPGDNIAPPVKTELLIAYSPTHLYAAFRAYDPDPSKIVARITDRDAWGHQDSVGIVMDTFNDQRRAYDFVCNPLGVQTDFVETSDGPVNMQFDAIWDSAGRITDWGYIVEMSIPLNSLRFQNKNGEQIWGFDATRSYPRRVRHHISLFHRNRDNNCYLCQMPRLIGLAEAKPGRNMELDPTLFAHKRQEREDGPDSPFITENQVEVGLSAKWGLTTNLTLNGTLNPDFSQVEADNLAMDINEPFAIFFPEKRPFFTEGSEIFNTSFKAVYTRTLRNPSWGLKLTGREGAHTVGAYIVRDTMTNLIFPNSESSDSTSLNLDSTATVLRYRHDFGRRIAVGGILTNREGMDYRNRVLGMDANWRLSNTDEINLQFLTTHTQYPGATATEFAQKTEPFDSTGLNLAYVHRSRSWNWFIDFQTLGRDFRADLGFVPQVGYREYEVGIERLWNAENGNAWFTELRLHAEMEYQEDMSGNLLDREFNLSLAYEGPLQTHSTLGFSVERERFNNMEFDVTSAFLFHSMKITPELMFYLEVMTGNRIDYDNSRLGKRFRIGPGLDWNLGKRIFLGLGHTFERMWIKEQQLYSANQLEARALYNFSRRMMLRAILQWVDYRYNTALYTSQQDPVFRRFLSQVLFSYKLNPQTVVYLGYADNYHAYRPDANLKKSDWTVFLKISYAWVI